MKRKITLRHWNWIVSLAYPDPGSDWTRRRTAVYAAVEAQDRAALAAEEAEIVEIMEEEATTLGGTLTRRLNGSWVWTASGEIEPRVKDLYQRDAWPNYRVRGNSHVEVLSADVQGRCKHLPPGCRNAAELATELTWVPAVADGTALSGDHMGMSVIHGDGRMTRGYADPATGETTGAKVIPEVYLVPVEEWDRRALRVSGAQWDMADQEALLAKARGMGWQG